MMTQNYPINMHSNGLLPNHQPDPEVVPRAKRRNFSPSYKLGILEEADQCERRSGQLGALLRREGLYSSHLTAWRRQRAAGQLAGLSPKKRGRKAQPPNPLASRLAELERENRKLKKAMKKAETIIEIQKKASELLGIPLSQSDNDELE